MLQLIDVQHSYDGAHPIRLPRVSVGPREHLLILGPSGSGKSTLLHILAGLLKPTLGKVILGDHDLTEMSDSERDAIRGKEIGVVFQRLYLSPALTCIDTLRAAQYLAGRSVDDVRSRDLLTQLGLIQFQNKFPRTLSLGQAQRLAIARGLVNRPKILLADEPTSSLDDRNAASVINLLKDQSDMSGASLIVATHDQRLKSAFSKSVELQ